MNVESLSLSAPAKINLGLEVIRRRNDGFHEVNTIYAAVNLRDEIELRPRDDGKILCEIEGNPQLGEEPQENNLCVRAARAVRELNGGEEGISIFLRKRIPTGAGLGGGSSDAASTLRGVARLLNAGGSPDELLSAAARLGSDVPFFLGRSPAHAGSRGEILEPIDLVLPWRVLLINPGIHVPTPDAYRAINRQGIRPATPLVESLRRGIDDPSTLRASMVNDFEGPLFAHYPLLARIKEDLYRSGAFFALMSGSGSTLFGLFEEEDRAEAARRKFPEYWSYVTGFTENG